MRWSSASLFFVCAGFVFFALWALFSRYLNEIYDAMYAGAPAGAQTIMDLLVTAFGVLCALFFITGILLFFFMDALAEEPEMYWRR
jgi:hypothetical protein